MTRTSTVIWSLVGLVVVLLGVLGAIYGPEMYRQGRAIVGPIVDIAQSDDRLAALNTEMPFEADPDGTIADDRFSVFLAIRRDLLPRYLEWRDIEQQLEQHGQEDWDSAREALSAIQGVMTLQFDTLKTHGMSPAEFVWIEDLVYNTWVPGAEEAMEKSAVTERLRETTAADKEALGELEQRYGSSRASREFTDLLDQRLRSLDNPGTPMVEGVSDATSALCWTQRDELANLDLAAYSRLHEILRGNNSVSINIDDDGE